MHKNDLVQRMMFAAFAATAALVFTAQARPVTVNAASRLAHAIVRQQHAAEAHANMPFRTTRATCKPLTAGLYLCQVHGYQLANHAPLCREAAFRWSLSRPGRVEYAPSTLTVCPSVGPTA